jgi:hypothetical protein
VPGPASAFGGVGPGPGQPSGRRPIMPPMRARVAALAAVLVFASPAVAQAPVPPLVVRLAASTVIAERDSNSARLYGYAGDSLRMPAGELVGATDVQLGHFDPARPSASNGHIGAGSGAHPGVLNLGADVSRAVRVQAEHRTVVVFQRTRAIVRGQLLVCDRGRCVDVAARLRRLAGR